MSIFCLCTCWRLKLSRQSGPLLNVAGPRSSPFPLANMDLCVQDSVFSASFSFSSLFSLRPLLCSTRQISNNVCTLKPEDFPMYKSLNAVSFPRKLPLLKFQWGTSRFDLSSDTFCSVLLCPFLPSHPNAVVGILHGAAYIRCNTEMSFSFTPLSQTLPYK